MVERINLLLKAKNITARQFAEEIGVQPSGMSHILSGRNNPSLDFVMKVMRRYPEIDINWLMFGKGEMYMSSYHALQPEVENYVAMPSKKQVRQSASPDNVLSSTAVSQPMEASRRHQESQTEQPNLHRSATTVPDAGQQGLQNVVDAPAVLPTPKYKKQREEYPSAQTDLFASTSLFDNDISSAESDVSASSYNAQNKDAFETMVDSVALEQASLAKAALPPSHGAGQQHAVSVEEEECDTADGGIGEADGPMSSYAKNDVLSVSSQKQTSHTMDHQPHAASFANEVVSQGGGRLSQEEQKAEVLRPYQCSVVPSEKQEPQPAPTSEQAPTPIPTSKSGQAPTYEMVSSPVPAPVAAPVPAAETKTQPLPMPEPATMTGTAKRKIIRLLAFYDDHTFTEYFPES